MKPILVGIWNCSVVIAVMAVMVLLARAALMIVGVTFEMFGTYVCNTLSVCVTTVAYFVQERILLPVAFVCVLWSAYQCILFFRGK